MSRHLYSVWDDESSGLCQSHTEMAVLLDGYRSVHFKHKSRN